MNRVSRFAACALLAASALQAGGSAAWESRTFADFLRGQFRGVSITRDGRLTLAPKLDALPGQAEAAVWNVVAGGDGTIYYSTGHRGKLYRLKPGGQPELVWTAPQPEIFALAIDARGRLFAGASPDGKVWLIENGNATVYFEPNQKYIWALACAADGALYVATGDQGRVFKVEPSGQGGLYYETGQTHVISLALDANQRLLAGTEPNGILYRIEAKGRAFSLYDANLPEIRAIVPAPQGSFYIAALGGGMTQKQAQAASTAATSPQSLPMVTTSITVTADAQAGVDLKPKAEAKPPAGTAPDSAPATPAVEVAGVEKAAIYRLSPDNTVETVWSSKEENVLGLALSSGEVVFSTDKRGRIYRLASDLKATLLVETLDGETTRLLNVQDGLIAATSNAGRLYRLSSAPEGKGTYESAVHDAGGVARWGKLQVAAELNAGSLVFRTRSGNSMRPDATWSEWSAPAAGLRQAPIASPNARYIQWQAELAAGTGAKPPLIDSVTVTYLPQNNRPAVRSVQVLPQWAATAQKTPAQATAQPITSYSVTVTDAGEAPSTSPGTPTQPVTRSGAPQILLTWQADDPDSDKLVYAVHYRAEDERDWKLLKQDLTENTLLNDSEVFADGRYFFRVTASDAGSNSPESARESELVSPPVLIDHTPPRVTASGGRAANTLEVKVQAADSASPLRRAEYSVNGSPWRIVDAADGVTDSLEESFVIRVPASAGEQSVVIRVFDAAGNAGMARVVVR